MIWLLYIQRDYTVQHGHSEQVVYISRQAQLHQYSIESFFISTIREHENAKCKAVYASNLTIDQYKVNRIIDR